MASIFKRMEDVTNGAADNIRKNSIINLDLFKPGTNNLNVDASELSESTIKKRGRPKKNKDESVEVVDAIPDANLPMHQSNQPYLETYGLTNGMLAGTIIQLDGLQNDIQEEVRIIKASKTMKRKYEYLSALLGTSGSLISTKVGAIKEMNKVITDTHNLELKRIKDLKLNDAGAKIDDDKYIMDMYNAYVNTPIGIDPNNAYQMPNIGEMSMMKGVQVNRMGIGEQNNYDNFVTNLTPSQNMIMMESNTNIQTVVMYDAVSCTHYFDVIDVSTGQSIPNADKPDQMFLDDGMSYDYNNGVASNKNLDIRYKLIVINGNGLNGY